MLYARRELNALRRPALRIPLYVKVMVSYLVVVGLVFLPTVVYLRSGLHAEAQGVLRDMLEREVDLAARRLAESPPAQTGEVIAELIRSTPNRITVLAPDGRVLGDSIAGVRESHADRPEVRDALAGGRGLSQRKSATAQREMIYAAQRFPAEGPVRGVVRVAVSAESIEEAGARIVRFTNHSGAVALSVAVLLSLIAALVVSRPLRRIAEGARAFAAGDFGFPVDVRSNDELGEVAAALEELAAQLRSRLLEAGSDRVTLRALLDDLPVGVILFDRDATAIALNGRARELCELSVDAELEDARRLLGLPDQIEVVRRVLRERISEEAPLSLPWRPGARLRVRWVPIAAPDGEPVPAAIIADDGSLVLDTVARARGRWVSELRAAAGGARDGATTQRLLQVADEIETTLPLAPPRAEEVEPVSVGKLFASAGSLSAMIAREGGVSLEVALEHPDAAVVEAGGRAQAAVLKLLTVALKKSPNGSHVRVRDELTASSVKIILRSPAKGVEPNGAGDLIAPLGGDVGSDAVDEGSDLWISLPRA
ncbi:MAG: HAMP domain-containing protein [Deltaproteobacteria bacterium]|nr:HAMP domain-containing protein [Deltaproteobacteria bacterium]